MNNVKAFEIPKELVWQAYRKAKKNRGAPGVDGQTFTDFDRNRGKNLYKIWNRLCSGSYLPPAVRAKEIPKADGGTRTLGIPTISDRIAQGAVKIYLESIVEPIFDDDSYGYRPGKSAHQAIEKTRYRCHKNFWLLEVDIKKFFDSVDHELVLKALKHVGAPNWVCLYSMRWMKAEISTSSGLEGPKEHGTPQGGVISPVLANLFLHFAIDVWLRKHWPNVEFARYADDLVIHCAKMRQAAKLKKGLAERLKTVGLEMHAEKTNIVYLGTFPRSNVRYTFTFLGFDFQYRTMRNFQTNELYRKVTPGASKKAMKNITQTIKGWRIHRSSTATLEDLARRYNYILRGWIGYYGKFWYRNFSYRLWSAMQSRLLKWFKATFKIGNKNAKKRLDAAQQKQPKLFAHWYLLQSSSV